MKKILIGLFSILLLTGCRSVETVPVVETVESETTSQETTSQETTESGDSQEPDTIIEETAVDRLNNYFNFHVKKDYDILTEYVVRENYEGFYFDYIVEPVTDDSEESLAPIVTKFAEYLPGYLFRIIEAYNFPTPVESGEYVLVMANSNISAASTFCSFMQDGYLHIEILIYDCFLNGGVFY